jgi:hypothetical protein
VLSVEPIGEGIKTLPGPLHLRTIAPGARDRAAPPSVLTVRNTLTAATASDLADDRDRGRRALPLRTGQHSKRQSAAGARSGDVAEVSVRQRVELVS